MENKQQYKMEKTVGYTNPITGEHTEKKSYVDMMFDDEAGYIAWTKKKSVKTYIDHPFPKEFTWAEKGRIETLKHYILKDNQFLVYRSNRAIKPIEIKQLCTILELSERRAKLFIKKMKQYVILKEVSFNGMVYYSFNPLYGLKDRRITSTLYLIFQEELQEYLPQWVITKFVEQAEELKPELKVIK